MKIKITYSQILRYWKWLITYKRVPVSYWNQKFFKFAISYNTFLKIKLISKKYKDKYRIRLHNALQPRKLTDVINDKFLKKFHLLYNFI